ncbi:MAG: hypothetical protein VXV91_01860 [Verrucomicrobiota bacterium]|nr:hypothetical protein [Verrucomicrobiota bacterium]
MIARFILIWVTLPLYSILAQEITMTLSPEECAPGDLVRLSFELESETFTEMTIGYRSPEGIHPVVTEKRPIEFNSQTQRYEQKEYWILQAMHSGEFLFSDLIVTLDGIADIKPIKMKPIRLIVTGFARTEDSATPEAWPPYLEDQAPISRWFWAVVMIPICFALYQLIKSNKKGKLMQKDLTTEDSLSLISHRLRYGDFPANAIERWLETDDAQDKHALRTSLQKALYSKTYDLDALLEHLDKETQL